MMKLLNIHMLLGPLKMKKAKKLKKTVKELNLLIE